MEELKDLGFELMGEEDVKIDMDGNVETVSN
jgi:hypothetical protein